MSLQDLRRIAKAADADRRPWTWSSSHQQGAGGYPQTVMREGDVVLIATCYEAPDYPARFAEFIATFDPPTVLALLDQLEDAP